MAKGKSVADQPSEQTQSRLMQMRVNDEFVALLDSWRRTQPDIPGRTEAVRRLVSEGIRACKKR